MSTKINTDISKVISTNIPYTYGNCAICGIWTELYGKYKKCIMCIGKPLKHDRLVSYDRS